MRRSSTSRAAAVSLAAFAATLIACAAGSSIDTGGSASQGSTGAGGGGGGGSTGTGGAVPTGDALPANAVSFFEGTTCPATWVPFDAGSGRLLLPSDPERVGTTHGTALTSGEDRTHAHTFTVLVDFASTNYVGAPGGGNNGVGVAGKAVLSGASSPSSTGLPYAQMLVCKKVGQPAASAPKIAAGMLMFFDTPVCPDTWVQSSMTRGRFLVGLPDTAGPDLSFGGEPLVAPMTDAGAGDAGVVADLPLRRHAHPNAGEIVTEPHGIGLSGGCCADGYAKNGTYPFDADTDAAETALPYVELLHCQKQ